MNSKGCLKWAAIVAGIIALVFIPLQIIGGSFDIAFTLGQFVGIFIIVFLFLLVVSGLESLFHRSRGGKKEFVTLDDSQAVAVIGDTVAQIPEIYSAAVRNKDSNNFAWCDNFLNSPRNVSQLRAEAWKRTETKFTEEEIKYYFRMWFNRF